MMILLFPSAYAPHLGGVEEVTYRLAKEYQALGHEVKVITARWPLDLPEREIIKGVEVCRVDYVMPGRRWKNLLRFVVLFPSRFFTLALLIRRFKPDVVHIQCVSVQGFYLLMLKWLLGFKLVVTLQGERQMDAGQVYQKSRLMPVMLKKLLNRADFVTACSRATLDGVADLWVGSNSKVIHNGISLEEFDSLSGQKELVPLRPYLFATGRQVYNKGFDLLIEAFCLFAEHYPEIDLIIGGSGTEHAALVEQAAKRGLPGRIIFPGYLNRIQTVTYFRHCLLFCLPSRYEPFGIVNLEAMAACKAVVAADVGGVPEIVTNGVNGLLAAPENPADLARAITTLLENHQLAEEMGRAGRASVETNFNWTKITGLYLELYRALGNK